MKWIKQKIPLTQNQYAIIDGEDFDRVSKFKWHFGVHMPSGKGYATGRVKIDGKKVKIYLHRFIMDAKKGQQIDHINRNPLDNRKMNLRFATQSENLHNASIRSDNTSGIKGVCWDKSRRKWKVFFQIIGENIFQKRFPRKVDAKNYRLSLEKQYDFI